MCTGHTKLLPGAQEEPPQGLAGKQASFAPDLANQSNPRNMAVFETRSYSSSPIVLLSNDQGTTKPCPALCFL
jgi:hypothetical protein